MPNRKHAPPHHVAGAKLRTLRQAGGFSQDDVAVRMAGGGASWGEIANLRSSLSRWENGHHRPTVGSQKALADALGVPRSTISEIYAEGDSDEEDEEVPSLQTLIEWAYEEWRYRQDNPRVVA